MYIRIYGFRSKSADPYTFLPFAVHVLSKNVLSSQAVKSFLSWSGSSSGHAETATLEVWETGHFLHLLVLFLSMSLKKLKPQSMTKNPITRNTFRHCRVRFCWTTFRKNSCIYTAPLLVNYLFQHWIAYILWFTMTTWLQESFCLALSTEWKH